MKKTLLCCVLAALLAVLSLTPAMAEGGWADVYETRREGVLQVRALAQTWTRESGVSTELKARASGLYYGENYVLTCAHLVYDCDEVWVEDVQGNVYEAVDILTDDSIDLSVLVLDRPVEAAAELTFDGEAGMTDECMVIGHATADDGVFPFTATKGIVSGLGRDGDWLGVFSRTMSLIQTDATLYGGFSGSGLFDASGRLLGMVILPELNDETASGTYYSYGFAVPAAEIAAAARDLIDYGTVRRPRMGVMVQEVDGPEEPVGKWPPCGVALVEIEPDSPAEKAGLEIYDIITHIDGTRVHNYKELCVILDRLEAGTTIHVTVYRCYDENGDMIDDPSVVEADLTLELM